MLDFFGSLTSNFFFYLVILFLVAIAGLFSNKTGIVNIGLNGFMVWGAVIYAILAKYTGFINPWFNLILIPLTGFFSVFLSYIFGLGIIKYKTDQGTMGIAINFLVLGIALFFLSYFGANSGLRIFFETKELALSTDSASFLNVISFKMILFILIGVISYVALNKTRWGLRFKSVGENPYAADFVGISVDKIKWQGVFISGFIATIAGAFFIERTGPLTFSGNVQGLGFLAIAVLIMGKWKIKYILISAFFFSLTFSASVSISTSSLEIFKDVRKYKNLFLIIPFVSVLLIISLFAKKVEQPQYLGLNYDKGQR